MYLETITFDRVFSVVHQRAKDGSKYTAFGFETGGRKIYEARVHGHPEVTSGMKVTLAMPASGRWTDIYGWINFEEMKVSTGEGIEGQLGPGLVLVAHFVLFAPLVILNWPYMGKEKWLIGFFSLLLPAILSAAFFLSKLRVSQARRLLTTMLTESKNAA